MTGSLVPQPFLDEESGIMAIYNGEIYNYQGLAKELGLQEVRSDGEVVVPLYRRFGEGFPRILDGEFALAIFDLKSRRAVLSTDIFSTKPLWYSRQGGGLRVATYRSAVERMGAPPDSIKMVDPNTMLILGLDADPATGEAPLLGRAQVVEFDTRQFKVDVSDFLTAFQRAVEKRMRSNHALFIGLSSGYDSGAIQVALAQAGQPHAAYTIYSTEDVPTLESRVAWTGDLVEPNIIVLSEVDRQREEDFLRQHCEFFQFSGLGRQGALVDDPASHGLSHIFREVRLRGMLVYLSGTGADEIISDYGFNGTKFFPHSSFGGLFPEDLGEIFPWPSFFLGTQRDYLMKEELVAGTHGLEGRYPFLDRFVVQEYLWLAAEAKNMIYKSPLHALLEGVGYPFIQGEKVGFNADWNVHDGAESIVLTTRGVGLLRREGIPATPKSTPRPPSPSPPPPSTNGGSADEAERELLRFLLEQERRLEAEERQVGAAENEARDALGDTDRAKEILIAREQELRLRLEAFDAERLQRIQAYLFVMVPRFARMRHTAASASEASVLAATATTPPPGAPAPSQPPLVALQRARAMSAPPVHPRWQSVEVVTCVSGGHHVIVADFPAYDIFRGTTPLPIVNNICEHVEWEGMHFRLRAYARFFREALEEASQRRSSGEGELPILYLVSDGMDVFFNDMSEVLGDDARLGFGHEDEALARATARLVAERYEAIANGDGSRTKPVVISTERLCGWGGAKLCSDEDEARYPLSPTDSKYLNAGGYIGPADALSEMIEAVLHLKEHAAGIDLEKGRQSDQYFFKRYFWDNQDKIALDYHQSIFGNFLEVVNRPCDNDWVPQCAVKPCCTESDHFKTFHSTFYGRYEVRSCAVWRQGNLPVSWHGNGAGKWLWLLAMDRLSLECPVVANLTLSRYPDDLVRGLFEKFEKRSRLEVGSGEYGAWGGGFLLREPTGLLEATEDGMPAECAA